MTPEEARKSIAERNAWIESLPPEHRDWVRRLEADREAHATLSHLRSLTIDQLQERAQEADERMERLLSKIENIPKSSTHEDTEPTPAT